MLVVFVRITFTLNTSVCWSANLLLDAAIDGKRRPAGRRRVLDAQIRFGIALRDAGTGELRWYYVAGPVAPVVQPERQIGCDRSYALAVVAGQQVVGLSGVGAQ